MKLYNVFDFLVYDITKNITHYELIANHGVCGRHLFDRDYMTTPL